MNIGKDYGFLTSVFGHAGDGNVHYLVLVDLTDSVIVATGEELYEMGRTVMGEHGTGLDKREYPRT